MPAALAPGVELDEFPARPRASPVDPFGRRSRDRQGRGPSGRRSRVVEASTVTAAQGMRHEPQKRGPGDSRRRAPKHYERRASRLLPAPAAAAAAVPAAAATATAAAAVPAAAAATAAA